MRTSLSSVLRRCTLVFASSVTSPPYPLVRLSILVSRYSSTVSTPTGPYPIRADAARKAFSAEEYRKYNRLAFNMEGMHHELRNLWLGLRTDCARMEERLDPAAGQRLIEHGLAFCNELEVHHDREETFLFPKLADRMPEFGPQSTLVDQHKKIHVGLAALKRYLLDCHIEEKVLDRAHIRAIMDTFSEVLLAHLDDEVYALRAERIRWHWTLDEFRKIP